MDMDPDAPTREMVALLAEAVGHLADAFRCLGSDDDATQAADAAIKSQRRIERAVPARDVSSPRGPGPA